MSLFYLSKSQNHRNLGCQTWKKYPTQIHDIMNEETKTQID